jgi:hypothetical protein
MAGPAQSPEQTGTADQAQAELRKKLDTKRRELISHLVRKKAVDKALVSPRSCSRTPLF